MDLYVENEHVCGADENTRVKHSQILWGGCPERVVLMLVDITSRPDYILLFRPRVCVKTAGVDGTLYYTRSPNVLQRPRRLRCQRRRVLPANLRWMRWHIVHLHAGWGKPVLRWGDQSCRSLVQRIRRGPVRHQGRCVCATAASLSFFVAKRTRKISFPIPNTEY